ncbi:transcriptional regulator [Sulfurimonas crateris]|uniref:Transcriptional regulator n=1 Tax=Sulfurimonas crateris TaxID=2574727 RepID=A0A4V5TLZ6_9BACT|nr:MULTISPECIES: transcriptional regulator [Sulfurimonas]MDT8339342.1 transcriptional regulator [Sulfurimonas sp.]TKI69793.1 transcriptional regulator [Sulfurimonas crateris]
MKLETLRVGIMPLEQYKKRTIAIAKGEYIPKKDEPKVWFESLKSMAQILSSENQELLRIILLNNPQSLRELEELSGRAKSNLSRTLKTLQRYGIVDLNKVKNNIVPEVKATDFKVEFGLQSVA